MRMVCDLESQMQTPAKISRHRYYVDSVKLNSVAKPVNHEHNIPINQSN